ILGEPGQNSVVPTDVVDQSPATDATESSDSDESSDSIGSAALGFEQFLATIKGGVCEEGGSNMDAEGAAVEHSDSDKIDAGDEEGCLEASPLTGVEGVARDGAMPQNDVEVLAQKPVVGGMLRDEAVSPSREEGSSTGGVGTLYSDEGPSEGERDKGRERESAVTAFERDSRPHSS
ncbi:unnamed protein product, partial [Laminaria digitata]